MTNLTDYENPHTVDILILGAGWTSTFLITLCKSRHISYAATSRPERPKEDTIVFEYDPTSDDPEPYQVLPNAQTVLVTFPVKVKGGSTRLVKLYEQTHPSKDGKKTGFIQLGSTGIWDVSPLHNIKLKYLVVVSKIQQILRVVPDSSILFSVPSCPLKLLLNSETF